MQLKFDEGFEDIIGLFKLIGDSVMRPDNIEKRASKVDEELKREAANSEYFAKIKEQGWY